MVEWTCGFVFLWLSRVNHRNICYDIWFIYTWVRVPKVGVLEEIFIYKALHNHQLELKGSFSLNSSIGKVADLVDIILMVLGITRTDMSVFDWIQKKKAKTHSSVFDGVPWSWKLEVSISLYKQLLILWFFPFLQPSENPGKPPLDIFLTSGSCLTGLYVGYRHSVFNLTYFPVCTLSAHYLLKGYIPSTFQRCLRPCCLLVQKVYFQLCINIYFAWNWFSQLCSNVFTKFSAQNMSVAF